MEKPELNSLNCDGSFGWKSRKMAWRVSDTMTGDILIENNFVGGSSNIAEFLAITDAILWQELNGESLPIYSDSLVAIRWVTQKYCGTWFDENEGDGKIIRKLINEALKYLKTTTTQYDVRKWETYLWGNVPSDFGNKFISKQDKEKAKQSLIK